MFLDYYGLHEQPFGVTPDPRFLYFGASHREALASLYYGVESGRGFLALIAKPGMGKTTLLFHLLGMLRNSTQTAFLFQTQCDSRQFLRSLMTDLGVECNEDADLFHLQNQLNEVLVRESQSGRRFVLVVDEAQNLEDPLLETLRMLSNFETPRAKLMQIILAGQPQLAVKLASERLVQLRQRISIVSRLNQLTFAETADYINHRLRVAGSAKPLFGAGALQRIAFVSEGIPRNINNLCFHALTLGFAKDAKRIEASILDEALADLALESCGPTVAIEEKEIADRAPFRTAQWIAASLPQRTSRFRRAGAGLLTISTVCAAAWLPVSGTSAITQSKESISTVAKSSNPSSTERVAQSLSLSGNAVRNTHAARFKQHRRARASRIMAPEAGIASFVGVGGDDVSP